MIADELKRRACRNVGAAEQISKRVAEQPSSVNGYSVDGFTPLHLAAHFNHLDAARVLLDAGAGVTAVSRNPLLVMPLHSAVAGRAYEATRLLLERGAPPNAVQAGGWTPVLSAAQHGDTPLLELLRSFGADCCAASPGGQTPRQVAIDGGHPDVAEWLAQVCSDAAPPE
jgi:ankyrin repeat protein